MDLLAPRVVTAAMKLRCLLLARKAMTNLDSVLKSRHHLADKDPSSQSCGFSGSHVWMWELNHREGWGPKNWCFWTVVLVKTLEGPLDSKDIKSVNPKGNQSWIFTDRNDAKPPIHWPLDVKSWLIGKDPDTGKDWGQEEKRVTEDEMIGWHHRLEQLLGDGERQGRLACWSPWGCRVRHDLVTKWQATTRKKGGGRAGLGPQTKSSSCLSPVSSLASYSLSTDGFSPLLYHTYWIDMPTLQHSSFASQNSHPQRWKCFFSQAPHIKSQ